MIDKWYFTNLNSRKDKAYAQEIVASVQRFPRYIFERFPASVENEDMPSTVREVCDMMVNDGFRGWSYDNISQDAYFDESPIRAAINWTRLRVLRYIAEKDHRAVLVTDMNYPVFTFDHISNVIRSAPPDMNILYLNWQGDPHHDTFNEECYNALAKLEPSGVKGIYKNFVGISAQVYLTSRGASEMLSTWNDNPVDFQALQMYVNGMDGCYVCDPALVLSTGDMHHLYPGIISRDSLLDMKDRTP